MHIALGEDFLGLCNKKSSYKYVSQFELLQTYVHFKQSKEKDCWKGME
jgi:hypothetical protein